MIKLRQRGKNRENRDFRGSCGIPGERAFRKKSPDAVPYHFTILPGVFGEKILFLILKNRT
jgi:hypothetical protein